VSASVSDFQTFDPARPVLGQPKCPNCGSLMWLIRIEPDEPNHDRRTFQCEECAHSHTEVVKYRYGAAFGGEIVTHEKSRRDGEQPAALSQP
jgi:hypothetical protein